MQKTIAVFFGGRSTEHDISIITALGSVIKPLELSKKYTVIPIYISKKGKWYTDEKFKKIQTFQSTAIENLLAKLKPLSVTFDGGMTIRTAGLRAKNIKIDIAFPAMHGTYGEDGSLMGVFRMAGIPFVGSDMSASVIAMDKVIAKQVIQANNIPTPKYVFFSKTKFEDNPKATIEDVVSKLRLPLFVKPAHLGSSIGIAKVNSINELQNAIEVAAYYDNKILVEESVENLIEVTVPIMGNEILQPASVERPLSGSEKFFDFNTKYINGGKKSEGSKKMNSQGYSEIPVKLSKALYQTSIDTAKKSYIAAGCEGISRVDLLIDSKSRTVYFNEINTLPGSLYAHNWRASGVPSVDLVCRLVDLSIERFNRDKKIETTFSSSFLGQF